MDFVESLNTCSSSVGFNLSYKNVHIKFSVSGITCIRYAGNQKIGKPPSFGSNKTKGSKIVYFDN